MKLNNLYTVTSCAMYTIDKKVRIGDHYTQHEIENSSVWSFGAKRKSGSGEMGCWSNEMF